MRSLKAFLKHLIKGDSTGGKFSYHLVKISEGCEIGDHIHEGKYEVHEVVGGVGKGVMNGVEIVYEPGVMVVVPDSVVHKISADKGIYTSWQSLYRLCFSCIKELSLFTYGDNC